MKEEKKVDTSGLSLSKQRKIQREKEIKKMKRNRILLKAAKITFLTVVIVGFASVAGIKIYREVTRIKPSSDFSAYLDDNGFISGINATDVLGTFDYKGLEVPQSEVEYTDEDVETSIQSTLKSHKTEDTSTETKIKDGDTVNIDYVGTVDGEEFSGGNTNGSGTDLEIGSGTYVDDFEQQLIGHAPGEHVTVNVTFPDPYDSNTELSGKDAVFEVTINSVYQIPEFTDDFVKENLSDYATTADGYREYLKETNYNQKLESWISTYIDENITVNSVPQKYFSHLKSLQKYVDESNYNYYKSVYTSLSSFEDYVGKSESQYDKSLDTSVLKTLKTNLFYQAIAEKEGISVTEDDYKAYLTEQGKSEDDYTSMVETYGKSYLMQNMIAEKALKIVKDNVVVK